jgi:hypothetical protein
MMNTLITCDESQPRHVVARFLSRLLYVLLTFLAAIAVLSNVLVAKNREVCPTGAYIVTVFGHQGGTCQYTVKYGNGIIWNFITPWPCEQPRAHVVIRRSGNIAGGRAYGAAEPFSPTRSVTRRFSDVLSLSYGNATLRVNADGTVPFTYREMAISKPTTVHFRSIGVQYSGLWRYAVVFVVVWLGWTSWLTAQQIRLRYHRKSGKCARCGYDLRATPERCPECGTVNVARR